jgi:hypothetical protein
VPLLLLALQANPLPDHLPGPAELFGRARQVVTSPDDGTLLLAVVQIVAWVGWGVFALSALIEGLAVAVGRTAPAIRGLAAVQRPAAYLVAVIAAALTTPAASAAAVPVLPAHTVADAPAVPGATPTPAGASAAAGDARTSPAAPVLADARYRTDNVIAGHDPARARGMPFTEAGVRKLPAVQVGRYDSLWRIADRHLGDGRRWTEIYQLNTGRTQPGGGRLSDPDHLEEGWTLLLPADARGTSPADTSRTSAGRTGSTDPGRDKVVPVRPGDTLSGIAERHLGTAAATPAVFEVNVGRLQPDGDRLTDPDLIRPGWRLTLPVTQSRATQAPPTAPPTPHPDRPPTQAPPPGGPPRQTPPAQPAPSSPASSPAPPTTPPPSQPTAPSTPAASTPAPSSSASAAVPSTSQTSRVPLPPGPGGERADRTPGGWVQLPSGSVLSLGLITVVAGLLELLRRRRRQHRIPGDPSDPEPPAAGLTAAARAAEEAWLAARRQLTDPSDGDPGDDPGEGPDERWDARAVDGAEGRLPDRPAADTDTDDGYFADPAADAPAVGFGLDPAETAAATGAPAGRVRRLRLRVPAPAADVSADLLAETVAARRGVSPGQFPAPSLLALVGPPAAAPLAQRAWDGGVGLVGPGAAGAARAVMARLLTATGPMGGELITTEAAVAELLPADAVEGFAATPGVTVFGTLRDALAACEAELLARARWLFDRDDLAGHREDPSALPVPAVLLLAHTPEATPADAPLAAHTDAVLRLGARRELGAILLGAWPPATLAVSTDGTLSEPPRSRAERGAASLTGTMSVGRVELLTAMDAADLLAGLIPPLRDALDGVDATTLLPPLSAPPTEAAAAEQPAEGSPDDPADPDSASTDRWGSGTGVDQLASSRAAQPAEATDTETADTSSQKAVLEVAVFGRVRLLTTRDGREVTGVRAKIRNLLALLAVHPDGLTSDQVGEALWPEAPPDRIPGRLSATLALTRRLLRDNAHAAAHPADSAVPGSSSGEGLGANRVLAEAGGDRVDLVPMVDGRYQLHPILIGSDHRRFTDALAAAAQARRGHDDASRRVALRTIADLYRGCDGDILGGIDYSWAIPIRERLRRQATDALATLASLLSPPLSTGDPRIEHRSDEDGALTRVSRSGVSRPAAADSEDTAPGSTTAPAQDLAQDPALDAVAAEETLEALEQAIEIDPYNEDLYRQVMRLHAAAGRREDVYQTLRLLEARLLDIDTDPEPATSTLVTQLLRSSPAGAAGPARGRRPDRTGPARRPPRRSQRG